MAKRIMTSGLAIKKKKAGKRKRKSSKLGGILKNVIDYLKSDSYMYSPLCSSPTSLPKSVSSNRVDVSVLKKKEKKKKLIEKVTEYLKSYDYMYTPVLLYEASVSSEEIQISPQLEVEAQEVMEGPTTPEKRSTTEAANILKDSNASNPVARTVVRIAKYHKEEAVHNHCLTPPLTGSVRKTRGSRNVIVE